MKNNQVKKRRRKDRTWAEAATLAIYQSSAKMLGIRPILHTIYHKKLKDISMNKAAENVLTTMLNHHAQLPNCPFYRVQGRNGVYALKESWLNKNGSDINLNNVKGESPENKTDSESPTVSDSPATPSDTPVRENHTFSIQGRPLPVEINKKTLNHVNSSYQRNSTLATRRHSSPMRQTNEVCSPDFKLRNTVISRTNSLTTRQNVNFEMRQKANSTFDLETPSSILVHANMRDLINRDTFSILPASYRYQLTKLLPDCDQILDPSNGEDKKFHVPSKTAFTNEFFTQAIQEWRERLSDGEFTRETQSRIMQELAKERSKIDPWKAKFFEEYYGQRQIPTKRLRSRSQNLAELGHQVRDLGMEAQLAKFIHLRPEAQNESQKNSDTDSADEDPTQFARVMMTRQMHSPTSPRSLAATNMYKKNRNSFAERLARTKLANSRLAKLRQAKVPINSKRTFRNAKYLLPNSLNDKPAVASSLVMKPSGALSLSALSRHQNVVDVVNCYSDGSLEENEETDQKILDVRRRTDDASATDDHSYTTTTWQQNNNKEVKKNSPSHVNHIKQALRNPSSTAVKTNTTLVLKPRRNFVNSSLSNINLENFKNETGKAIFTASKLIPSEPSSKPMVPDPISSIRPTAHITNSGFVPLPDTERVLSLCARPLTPESFVGKPGHITSIRQVPSPLSIPAYTDSGTINRVSVTTSYSHPITVSSSKEQNQNSQSSKTLILSQPAETNTNTIKEISLHTQRVNAMNSLPQLTPRVSFTTSVMTPSTTYTVTKTPHFSTPVSIIVKPTSSAQELKLEAQKINNVPGRNIFEQFSPPMLQTALSTHIPIAASPVAPGKLTVAGTKRSHSITPPSFSYSSSPHTRWPTPNSPSPAKKTRTLAEIKAQMKARKAAAASNTRPQLLPVQAQGVVANTASHIFSATTFPVYFPVVSEQCSKVAAAIPASRHTTPGYVRVNATLPLEKVQWISHPGTPQGPRAQAPKLVSIPKSTVVHNHNVVGPAQIIKPNHQVVPPISKDTPTTKKTVQNSVNQKGKIILKIKTAGSAISLKVDADVIKKEFNRSTSSNDEEHESEEEDSRSDDSHDHKKLCKKKNKRSISSGGSSDSGTDICKPNKRWCPDDLDTGQPGMRFHESKSDPSSSTSATTMLVKANTASPVFGVSPYSVNVAPAMTETPCHRSITSSTLFNQKTNSSFAFNNPTNNSWQINKSIAASSTVTGVVAAEPMNKLIRPASKFRSTSKGKSLQNMQELARTNMIHSDDSAEESSDDDSTIITTTASEKESDSENEATIPIRRSVQTAIANQTSLNMAHKPSFKQNDAPS